MVPVFRLKCLNQELFHRNFENGHPMLAAMGFESDRLPRSVAIYYV